MDVPCEVEISVVGHSRVRKFAWLCCNMFILPFRSLYKVEVEPNPYVILNWIVCLSTTAAVGLTSMPALVFLGISLFMSQGLHPANARQLQRHYWDGSAGKAVNGQGGAAMTFSYYGWSNAIFLNVGYHNEHHDFVQVAWTRLPALRAMVGDAFYPDSAAYDSRGWWDLANFVLNRDLSLANFYSASRAPERVSGHEAQELLTKATIAAAASVAAAAAAAAAASAASVGGVSEAHKLKPAIRLASAASSSSDVGPMPIPEDPPVERGSDEVVEDPAGPPASDQSERATPVSSDGEPLPSADTESAAAPVAVAASPVRRRRLA